MKKTLILSSCLLALAMSAPAFAQRETVTQETDTTLLDRPSVDILKIDTIEYISNPSQNYFFTLQVGLSHSMSENVRYGNFLKAERLSYIFSAGKFFYPQFGMRMSLGLVNQASFVESTCQDYKISDYLNPKFNNIKYKDYYKFSMAQFYIDGLIDFHSVLFGAKERRRWNVIGFLGLGYFQTFNFDKQAKYWNDMWEERQAHWDEAYNNVPVAHQHEVEQIYRHYDNDGKVTYVTNFEAGGAPDYRDGHYDRQPDGSYNGNILVPYPVNTKSRGYLAGHIGLWGVYKINDKFDVNFEAAFNGTDDAYNGVRFRRVYDSYVSILAGVTLHIPDPEGRRRYRYSHLTDADKVDVLNRTIHELEDSLEQAQAPKVQIVEHVVEYNEMLQTTVQFYIDRTFITEAQEKNVRSVANFMKTHPEINVVVTGYADVQTAYPAYNLSLSKKRAENVYNMLVEKYGIDPARLKKDWKGDKEQAFSIVNEWNRSVVFFIEKPKPVRTIFQEEVTVDENGETTTTRVSEGSEEVPFGEQDN